MDRKVGAITLMFINFNNKNRQNILIHSLGLANHTVHTEVENVFQQMILGINETLFRLC